MRTPVPSHKQHIPCQIKAGMNLFLMVDKPDHQYEILPYTVLPELKLDSHGRPTIAIENQIDRTILHKKLEELACDIHIRKKAFTTKAQANKELRLQTQRSRMPDSRYRKE